MSQGDVAERFRSTAVSATPGQIRCRCLLYGNTFEPSQSLDVTHSDWKTALPRVMLYNLL